MSEHMSNLGGKKTWRPIQSAPKDGTIIEVLQRDDFSDLQSVEVVSWADIPYGAPYWQVEGTNNIPLFRVVLWRDKE